MTAPANWADDNQKELIAALSEVRSALEALIAHRPLPEPEPRAGISSALDVLCALFGLSRYERGILLLCAGVELQSDFASLCAEANGSTAAPYPTFALAMSALPDPSWAALVPSAPLRRWDMIEVGNQPGLPLVMRPLRIDERILHFLAGVQSSDPRLTGVVEGVPGADCSPSQESVAQGVAALWTRRDVADAPGPMPVIQLIGGGEYDRRAVAAAACREVRMNLSAIDAQDLPTASAELETFVRLWDREAVLTTSVLMIEGENRESQSVPRFAERSRSPLILSAREPWRLRRRASHVLEVRKPTADEQRGEWESMLNGSAEFVNGEGGRLSAQFDLSLPSIREAVSVALAGGGQPETLGAELWSAGLSQARPRFDGIAQRIDARAGWDDLVLPDDEKSLVAEIAANVRQRAVVWGAWGFAEKSTRGLGISALFSGPSGTGKTMAAEVLANLLRLDLYRIDLSSAVSKYIGETEKNLRRVFDAAEDGGAILFFDEADALFGKRSEVKDSHDRYANIEINYLLQRIEEYRGLAVLATNMKSAIDPAFLRRIRFVVNFPLPDFQRRAEIWERAFPAKTPVEGLDIGRLAALEVSGGNIRNIALSAAFLAADDGEPVRMDHIWRAARSEFAKVEKPFTRPS